MGKERFRLLVDSAQEYELRDSGIGFEQNIAEQIIEVFMQLSRSITEGYGGLGLGLAIAKVIVQAHGGRISAKSDGRRLVASFVVRLPLLKDEKSNQYQGSS